MSATIVKAFSKFPSWVPQSSAVVNCLILVTSFSTATVLGYDASMMNALNILPSYVDYFSLSSATIGLNSGIVWIGAIIGSMILAKVPDHIGRKPGLFYSATIAIIGSLLQGCAQDIAMFLVARFILGFGLGGTYVAGPLLIAETLPLKWRSIGLGAFTDLYYAGGLLSAGVTFGTAKMDSTWAWRLPSLLQVLFTLCSLLALPFIPESPRFLVHQGRQEEALKAVAQTHSNGDTTSAEAQAEVLQITHSYELERNIERPTVKQIVKTPGLRKRMIIVTSAAAFSQLTGAGLFSYYLGSALNNAGVTDSTTQLEINIILNSFCLLVSILGTFLAERLGRKLLAEISTIGCAVFLLLIGVLTKFYGNSTNTSAIYANVAMIFLAQGSYSFAWTPLATIYPSEILNYSLRSVGVAWFTIWQNGFLLIPIFAFPVAMESIGWIIYILNSGFDFLVILFIAWYWVETKGLSLEEISGKFDENIDAQLIDSKEAIQKAELHGIDALEVMKSKATETTTLSA